MQWAKYLRREAARKNKKILWLNLDESNIPVVHLNARGTLKTLPRRIACRFAPKIKASQTAERLTYTLVACISNVPAVQVALPQVILVGDKNFSWTAAENLWPQLPPNIYLRRRAGKGWTNVEEHKTIIDIIGRTLQPFLDEYQPVLVFDALKCHLDAIVLDEIFLAQGAYNH